MQGLQKIIKDRPNFNPQYPTLILVGKHDIELEKRISKEWHNQLKNSKYFLIGGQDIVLI
jgi:hypothetical protein